MISKLLSKTLYEQDYPQWLATTLQQLEKCPYTIDQLLDVEYLPPFTYL
ncbi:hypothetical protein [Dolichospermum compactum]|uniref:DUF29 domain-containing protein n=1 Tax=Dolichospermum compactum NIES-806 TaxID=1973481 RepID=A0A1Z4V4G6_9CYAN|nr:hypothetical protein [Dolichospermum compactum]BAZ86175.1 hypothetical protein NIES806_23860 [Dolichospermum compactum NIES-806]